MSSAVHLYKPKAALSAAQRDALRVMGHTFLRHHQFAKAIVIFEGLNALEPDDSYTLRALAYSYLSAERYQEVLAVVERLEQMADASPVPGWVALVKGKALWGLDRRDEAKVALAQFVDDSTVVP